MKAKSLFDLGCIPCDAFPNGIKPAGTITDHPDAYKLVQQGCAEPADEECAKRAGITEAQWKKAVYAYQRLARGIHPDDFAAYDRGEMIGYYPDGSFKPGPNNPGKTGSIDTTDLYEEDEYE